MSSSITAVSPSFVQNCFNGIAHRVYAVHDSICGLCSADTKVYTLLILGRMLQAAALVAFAASIASVTIMGPAAFLGLIPALAFGALGTYIAGNPQALNDMMQMARPFVPGQPIGLINNGNNCWLNSSLQVLSNVPAYQARLRQIPTFAQFLDQYAAAEQNYNKVAQNIDIPAIRQFLSTETAGQIRSGSDQEDAAQFFEYLFQGVNAQYAFDQQINAGAPTVRQEPMIQIFPGLQQPRPNFQRLFNCYFDHYTEVGQHLQLHFQHQPNDLLIQIKRFYQHRDSAGTYQQGKITDPIDIPARITLSHQYVRGAPADLQFETDGYLIHRGSTLETGHYLAYIKKNGIWWYCSDTAIYEVSAQQALDNMKHGDIFHFAKVPA